MSEFFNRSVGKVVEVGTPMPYDLPHETASIRDGVLRDASGKPIVADYVLAPCDVEIAGQVVATDRHVDSRLYAVEGRAVRISRPVPAGGASCDRPTGDRSWPALMGRRSMETVLWTMVQPATGRTDGAPLAPGLQA